MMLYNLPFYVSNLHLRVNVTNRVENLLCRRVCYGKSCISSWNNYGLVSLLFLVQLKTRTSEYYYHPNGKYIYSLEIVLQGLSNLRCVL